jgi:hypothetical protein
MGLYHCLWHIHHTAVPINDDGWARWQDLLGWVREQMQNGFVKDWGEFVGELNGYAVVEGSEFDLASMAQRFITVCSFEMHPIASVDTVGEMIRAIARPSIT